MSGWERFACAVLALSLIGLSVIAFQPALSWPAVLFFAFAIMSAGMCLDNAERARMRAEEVEDDDA